MRKIIQSLPVFLFVLFLGFFVFVPPTSAESTWWSKTFGAQDSSNNYVNNAGEGPNNETSTSEVMSSAINWVNVTTMGGETVAKMGGASKEHTSSMKEQYGEGAISMLNKGIVALYTPPASGQSYIADVLDSTKLVPQAHAQGLGFSSLDTVLETWKQFRNVAYMFFVIVFLVIGFMIMFRTKVGQAAITAQQAIPNIIVALLAVTFSYAIAGFMIDLMYLLMYLLVGLFGQVDGTAIMDRNVFGFVSLMFNDAIASQGSTASNVQQAVEQAMEDFLNIGFVGEALAWLSSLGAAMIVGIAILITTFKIFVELLKTYIVVIIQIVFSPIILMFGALPGKNALGSWVKNLAGNLLMWPVVLLCVLIERMLTAPFTTMSEAELNSSYGGGFMPPFLFGQGQARIIPVMLGVGILLVIPEVMKQAKKAFGVTDGPFAALAGDGWSRIKQAIPYGKGATTFATSVGTTALGALGGAALGLNGEGTLEEKFDRGKKYAFAGAVGGALAPSAIVNAPKIIKSSSEVAFTQGKQLASNITVGAVSSYLQAREAQKSQKKKRSTLSSAAELLNQVYSKGNDIKSGKKPLIQIPVNTRSQSTNENSNSKDGKNNPPPTGTYIGN
jgi:hypothetical protein